MDDYFNKSAEFRAWLSKEVCVCGGGVGVAPVSMAAMVLVLFLSCEQRRVFFSDLTSEQSRRLFKKFVSRWNSGRLKKVEPARILRMYIARTA